MKIKDGVIMNGLKIEMRPVLILAMELWSHYGKELVVTAGLDGKHSAGSLHYYGYALDFRSRYFTDAQKKVIISDLKRRLGKDYDVVLESTHIHVEYDPKG